MQLLPPEVNLVKLQNLVADYTRRETLLRQVIRQFEGRYQCSLMEFERKLNDRELPEHPCWEESIEWRNAVEQIQNIQLVRSIFTWLIGLIMPSRSS